MDPAIQGQALKELRGKNRNQAFVITVLSVAVLVLGMVVIGILGTERTIVIPPSISKSFWVTSSKASADYLEQMAGYVGWLILDASPASIDWKKDALLTYMAPDQYGAMKTQQEVEAERLKKTNAATQFALQQVIVDEPNQAAVLRGRLRTQINGVEAGDDLKAYLVEFKYAGGRIHLATFKEIPYDNHQQSGVNQAAAVASNTVRAGQ